MKQKIGYLSSFFFSIVFLFSAAQAVAAEEGVFPVRVSCEPESSTEELVEKTASAILTEENVTFRCLVRNKDASMAPLASLLGTRKSEQSGAAVSMSEVLVKDPSVVDEVLLQFPKMLRSDTYRYSFVLIDKATRMPLSEEQRYTWKLSMDQPSLVSVGVEPKQEQYEWDTQAGLRVELSTPKGQLSEDDALGLRVVMNDEKGDVCAVLVETSIRQSSTYQMRFPKQGVCVGVIGVTLTSKDGVVLDQSMLSLQFPDVVTPAVAPVETGLSDRWLTFVKWGILLLTIFSLVFVLGVRVYRQR